MAFRNKLSILEDFNPDVAIIQECENENVFNRNKLKIEYNDYNWCGENKNNGLGVINFNGYYAKLLNHDEQFEYILPVRIVKDRMEFYLLAIWTQLVNKNIYESYVVQAARAFNHYRKILKKENILIMGDFNSNSIWDNVPKKEFNHSDMVNILLRYDIVSLYHHNNREKHGEEKVPTLFLTRNIKKPYHVDYVFLKQSKIKNVKSFAIGDYKKYIKFSDHMPLLIDINFS